MIVNVSMHFQYIHSGIDFRVQLSGHLGPVDSKSILENDSSHC
jgi:hypothetical protein